MNVLTRTLKRFDSSDDFRVKTLFPVVRKVEGRVAEVILFEIYYSSHPMRGREYQSIPTSNADEQLHCDRVLFKDINTSNSVLAAIQAASMAPNAYLSTSFPNDIEECVLSGASVGLAIFACVMGLPPFVYTGWVSTFGLSNGEGSGRIGPIDSLEYKMEHCANVGIPLFFPGMNECATSTLIRCYKSRDFLEGMPYHRKHHIGVSCVSLFDVILLSSVIAYQFENASLYVRIS